MRIFKSIPAFLFLLVTAQTAQAATACAEYGDMKQVLDGKYQEKLSAFGLSKQQDKVEIYVSKAGTFTILATRADGVSCIVAVGDNWELELKNLSAL
jgi:hypothetical protein